MCKNIRCVYCNKILTKKNISKEHVIQNALGGLLESTKICCSDCNNKIGKYIDNNFVKIFNPIVGNIINLNKTNNSKSMPTYTGKSMYNDNEYTVTLKNKKIIACNELSKTLKRNLSKTDIIALEDGLIGLDFNIDNKEFKNGIGKIAFNFAIEKNISPKILKKKINITDNTIEFSYPIIPFIPMNNFDNYIENEVDFKMHHSIILFSQENKLWCYIDLFNTFQYYVLLNNTWDKNQNVIETHCQYIEKIDRTIPKINIRKHKDILNYSQYYNVKPNIDIEEFKKQIRIAIQKKSLLKDLGILICEKSCDYFSTLYFNNKYSFLSNLQDYNLYIDENDNFNANNFRQKTYYKEKLFSYPYIINYVLKYNYEICKKYTYKKFQTLTNYLLKK